MRVLQISYDMNMGGAETLIMNIYRNIDRTKIQFDFLLHSPDESAYEKEILSLGGRIYRIKRYLGYNRLSYEKELTSFLDEHPEYEIIHDHLMNSAAETLRVANRLGRITVAHSHTAMTHFSPYYFFYRNLWKIAKYRFACSEAAGKWLYRNKADFTVLKNGIDSRKYAFNDTIRQKTRAEFGIDGNTLVIGNIGRMSSEKNQVRLIDIFKTVTETNPNSKLMIVGDGPQKKKIEDRISRYNLEDKVIMTGLRSDIPNLLMAMDVFLFPSLFEGLGIVLVEAQASGLPCFFTDSIPHEAEINKKLTHRISLKEKNSTWSEQIVSSKPADNREDAWKRVKENGYDIRESASQLESFFLSIGSQKQNV